MFARRRTCIRILGAALLVAVVTTPPGVGADPADQQLAPIPDIYVGSWSRHGSSLSITRPDAFPEAGNLIAQWRTYTWCQDPVSKKANPPPCDMIIGNSIEDGGLASIALLHPEGQDDKNISGVVTATTDPSAFGKQGADVLFTMLPGNMLLVNANGQSTMYCGDNTDYSLYPPYPCGA
jgi:hypothetical protein